MIVSNFLNSYNSVNLKKYFLKTSVRMKLSNKTLKTGGILK